MSSKGINRTGGSDKPFAGGENLLPLKYPHWSA